MSSNQQLAEALGVNVRTLERDRLRGLPAPNVDEPLPTWVERARKWKKENRRKPGPRAGGGGSVDENNAVARFRVAKAQLLELQLAERRTELHSSTECHAEFVQRLQEMRNAFAMMPDKLARRLYQAPSPDAIKVVVEEELRACFEVLSRDEHVVDAGDAQRAAVAGAPDSQPVGGPQRPAGQ